ncbi:HU family DNA-binding protein [uncultured Bacteroides sp.]|uniref:HU family DNA-binding protein n=1 Tax=uncultured Bacteroides sp. TaxID=162156 RepID=UPI002AA89270|nr:HU family DNA-binding protein [uncultured Bacteroides sp.]
MPKSVMYSVVERKNPSIKDAPVKYYAQAQSSGDVDSDEMAERIEKNCTVTRADVTAVLTALEDTISEGLQKGEIVRLGKLGSFQIGLNGKGADTEKEFSVSLIKQAKINFRPGTALSKILPGLSYSKVSKIANRSTTPDDGEVPDPDDPGNGGGGEEDPDA